MNTVRTLSTTQHSSLQGPIFSSTLLRRSADGESRSYPVRGIVAIILLAGASAVTALPTFAPIAVTSATDNDAVPGAVAQQISEADEHTGSVVVGAVGHPPAVSADGDALSLANEDLVHLLSAPDQDAAGVATAALIIEEIAPATDGDDGAGDSSDQGSGQTGNDQATGAAAPPETSGTGESESGDADGGESAGGEADNGGDAQGDNNGNGQGNGNGNGGGPSDNSHGNGPPQETPGKAPSGDNPGSGSPQGNPSGQSSGQGSSNGNGNGKK